MNCLLGEEEKINYFFNSNDYLKFNKKYTIKYEDIIFEKKDKKKEDDINIYYEKIIFPNNPVCSDCSIYYKKNFYFYLLNNIFLFKLRLNTSIRI